MPSATGFIWDTLTEHTHENVTIRELVHDCHSSFQLWDSWAKKIATLLEYTGCETFIWESHQPLKIRMLWSCIPTFKDLNLSYSHDITNNRPIEMLERLGTDTRTKLACSSNGPSHSWVALLLPLCMSGGSVWSFWLLLRYLLLQDTPSVWWVALNSLKMTWCKICTTVIALHFVS